VVLACPLELFVVCRSQSTQKAGADNAAVDELFYFCFERWLGQIIKLSNWFGSVGDSEEKCRSIARLDGYLVFWRFSGWGFAFCVIAVATSRAFPIESHPCTAATTSLCDWEILVWHRKSKW